MTKKRLSAILWRRVNKATVDTLTGQSPGQYDIRLGSSIEIGKFFEEVPRRNQTALEGFTLDVPLQPFDGTNPVSAETLVVRYMGQSSARRDWYIPSQRPSTAYPLWRVGRGLPSGMSTSPQPPHYIILAKDIDGNFHARWLTASGFALLPKEMKSMAQEEEVGVYTTPSIGSDIATDITKHLKEHFNVLIYGPPGTGKTHLMQEVVQNFGHSFVVDTEKESEPVESSNDNVKVGWVTFHQSYSYEEFIVGLRPDPSSDKQLSLVAVPGLLLELAEFARQPGNSALLIIDEINRGNVSRIFGEFITLIEPDKRLADDGSETPQTVKIRLPYIKPSYPVEVDIGTSSVEVPNPFTMPRRFYTLASMNSVDKSIAPLDTALRRRFQAVNLLPDLTGMADLMKIDFVSQRVALSEVSTVDQVKLLSLSLLDKLNRGISFYLGPEYALGHWYLSGLVDSNLSLAEEAKEILASIWKSQLLPQLEELFHGRIEQLQTVLNLKEAPDVDAPVFLVSPTEEVTELGGAPYLCQQDVTVDQIIRFLMRVSGVASASASEILPLEETITPSESESGTS
jgi:5-methylcytosine-specific restriction protein B